MSSLFVGGGAPSKSLSRRIWPYAVVLLALFSWDRAGWLYLSPRDDARAAAFTGFPMLVEDEARGDREPKAATMEDWHAVQKLEGRTWYMLAYVFGKFQPWLILSAWLLFSGVGIGDTPERSRRAMQAGVRRAILLSASIGVAGLGAEILKHTLRRVRPEYTDGWFAYIPFWQDAPDPVSFGLPSSHAAVAFAAAIAVGRMVPSTRWALYPLAVLCALSRVLVGAHFLSDVYIGALVGVLGERVIYALADGRRDREPA